MYVLLLLVMCTQSIQIVDPHRFFMSVQCPRQLVPVLGRGEGEEVSVIFCSCIDLGCEILEPFFKVSLTLSELLARQRK